MTDNQDTTMSDSEQPRREATATSGDEREQLVLRNVVIALCLAALGAFVTVATVVTVLVATNFNVLDWME